MNVASVSMIVRVGMSRMSVIVVVARAVVVGMVAHQDHSTCSEGGCQPRVQLSGKFDTRLRGMD